MIEKIKSVIEEQIGYPVEVEMTTETNFKEDLGLDSLDLMELVTCLEDEYNIEVPAEDLIKMKTVGDVLTYLKGIGITA